MLHRAHPFELELAEDRAGLTIRVYGRKLDITCAHVLKEALDKFWAQSITTVVVDLARVDLVDSSGIGALVSMYKRLPPGSPPPTIANAHPAVVAVFDVLRLTRVFRVKKATTSPGNTDNR
jgi:anti-anti-sigma factor